MQWFTAIIGLFHKTERVLAQTAADLNVPYKFFGQSESLSWLAQFAGQGFEDIAALSNLILLQLMLRISLTLQASSFAQHFLPIVNLFS